ncbi:MAG: hypoxanthine phosphoribosyltransferase [Desulfomonilaceae bacterium]|nr:hypoxanthine phosphoribosyltransferase [Desulfomonilaceae bacterium]
MKDAQKKVLFRSEDIASRVCELGRQISADYPEGNILLIGILKGAFVFLADLVRCLDQPCQIDFARISSYGSGTVSSGELKITMDIGIPVAGRDVILVDDIVDTGLTLNQYRDELARRGPRSLKVAAMIDKTARRERHVKLDYCGFRIDDGFLVGYGLDCDECFRNLGSIYVLE